MAVDEQDGRGVDLELRQDLIEDDPQRQANVQTPGDGQVDLAEGVEAANSSLQLRVEVADRPLGPVPMLLLGAAVPLRCAAFH